MTTQPSTPNPQLVCNRLVWNDEKQTRDYCKRPATHRLWTGALWLHLCEVCADHVRQATWGKKEITKIL